MKITDTHFLSEVERFHDQIKMHPFRESFDMGYASDYKYLMFEMSDVIADYIYLKDHGEAENAVLRQFGRWIHDYRANLGAHRAKDFPMNLFDYYEKELQVIHNIIKTGEICEYYDIVRLVEHSGADTPWNSRCRCVERYELITSDRCGVTLPDLPRFMPVEHTIVCDESLVRECVRKWSRSFAELDDDDFEKLMSKWREEKLPIVEYVNSLHRETCLKIPEYASYFL